MSDDPEQSSHSVARERNHMSRHPQNNWGSVRYDARFDEYGVPAGEAWQCLFYCPWCGEKLPASKRDQWFDAIEALGLDPWHDEVPEPYRSGTWQEQARSNG